jgi:Tfp pilus assembly ATPase PilU
MDIGVILTFAKENGASDLHISTGEPPIVRIDGDIQKVDMPALSKEEVHSMLYDILNDHQRKIFEEKKEIDLLKETMKQGVQEGMQTFDQAIYDFYMQGELDYDTAIAYADSANDLRLRIKFDTPEQEDREEETEYKSTFKIREQ